MTLMELNNLGALTRSTALAKCCGAQAWVEKMNALFPLSSEVVLLAEAKRIWFQCSRQDWLEAFTHHPKIGGMQALKEKFAAISTWAEEEQLSVKQTSETVLQALAAGNAAYEDKFGYIFIVCATGKAATEMLDLLLLRLKNTAEEEIYIAMQEQGKITALRLQKLLAP